MSVETARSIASSFAPAHLGLIDRWGHDPWIDHPAPYFTQIESFWHQHHEVNQSKQGAVCEHVLRK